MPDIRIAHISDLHFGSNSQRECWDSLRPHLRDESYSLIVVTGDLVHQPDPDLYREASSELSNIGKPFYVCPGNHDRYVYGTKLNRRLNWVLRTERKYKEFFKVFEPRLAPLGKHCTVNLNEGNNSWKVCVVSADSTVGADFFARGHIDHEQLGALGRLTFGQCGDADLSILLVHHHALPIPELERRGKLRNVADVSSMVNAGTFLEVTAYAPIDLLLHGHQHARHLARFGSGNDGGEVVVVGAGSATGNDSFEGCKQENATFNVILLHSDRSVSLESMQYRRGNWQPISGSNVKLFSQTGLRRAQFRKRTANDKYANRTRSKKSISCELTPEGILRVSLKYSNWMIEGGRWTVPVRSSEGEILDVSVQFSPVPALRPEIEYGRDSENNWVLDARWPEQDEQIFDTISIDMVIEDGACLTASAFQKILKENNDLSGVRAKGYEHLGVKVDDPLQAAQVHVFFPAELVPNERPVGYVTSANGDVVMNPPGIGRYIEELGLGHFRLSVPFPVPGSTYGIAWRPPEAPPLSGLARGFVRAARANGDSMAKDLIEYLQTNGAIDLSRARITVDLHVSDGDSRTSRPEEPVGNARCGIAEEPTSAADTAATDLTDELVIRTPIRYGLEKPSGFAWGSVVLSLEMCGDSQIEDNQYITRLSEALEMGMMKVITNYVSVP